MPPSMELARYNCLVRRFELDHSSVIKNCAPLIKALFPENKMLAQQIRGIVEHSFPIEYPFIFKNFFLMGGGDLRRIRRLPAALHILQTSTFVIDDVVDNSNKRFGRQSALKKYGADRAFLIGEAMQTASMQYIANSLLGQKLPRSSPAFLEISRAMSSLYRGQYLDLAFAFNFKLSVNEYFKMINLTTAQLLSACAASGALLSNLHESHIGSARSFGVEYGTALQIFDDVVDLFQTTTRTGKTAFRDLFEGRARLPVLIAHKDLSGKDKRRLSNLLSCNKIRKMVDCQEATDLIAKSGALEYCTEKAHFHVSRAIRSTENLPDCRSKQYLVMLAESLATDIEEQS